MSLLKPIKNRRGQTLVEYLLIISLIAVGSIGMVRYLTYGIQGRMGNVFYSITGKEQKRQIDNPDENLFRRKDMGNFMNGAVDRSRDRR